MKLRDHDLPLLEPAVFKAMVNRSVYASMALESQVLSLDHLEALYVQSVPASYL